MRIFIAITFFIASVSWAATAGLYFKRTELYALTEIEAASYGELYPPSETALYFSGFETNSSHELTPLFQNLPNCSGWTISVDGRGASTQGPTPILKLSKGLHDYVLTPQGCQLSEPNIKGIELELWFGTSEDFGVQNVATDQFQINESNIAILLDGERGFSRWVPDVAANPMLAAEVEAARDFIYQEGFDETASTREKIRFLTSLVRKHLPGGSPPPILNTITPWSLFQREYKKPAGNFCRQFSLGYAYLANVVGIPSRNLMTGGAVENIDLGSHAFSESYIAEEARWALVDPSDHIAYITNGENEVLNAAQLYMQSTANNTDTLKVHKSDGTIVPYSYDTAHSFEYYIHPSNNLIYIGKLDGLYQMQGHGLEKLTTQIVRYLFYPKQYFGLNTFTSHHWLRPFFFFSAVLSSGLCVLGAVVMLRRRFKRLEV